MPWEHCENALRDDESCPTCGITKEKWTLEWNVTRTFQVSRSAATRFSLVDEERQPIEGEPWEARLPDGKVMQGELDRFGEGRVPVSEPGDVEVSFPRLYHVARIGDGTATPVEDDEDDGVATFSLLADSRTDFEVPETPPSFLVPLEHYFYPGKDEAGAHSKLEPGKMTPGFVPNETMQAKLDALLRGSQIFAPLAFPNDPSRKKKRDEPKRSRLRIAVVDLTGKEKLLEPELAGHDMDIMMYAASSAKCAAIYAAHQLRCDVRVFAKGKSTEEGVALARTSWKEAGLSKPHPRVEDILDLDSPGKIDFKPELEEKLSGMFSSIDSVSNGSATWTIKALGFPFIASAMWQSGLYRRRGGLFLGKVYGEKRWDVKGLGGWMKNHRANARALATYLTLIAQDKCIGKQTSIQLRSRAIHGQAGGFFLNEFSESDPPIAYDDRTKFGKPGFIAGKIGVACIHLELLDEPCRFVVAAMVKTKDPWRVMRPLAHGIRKIITANNAGA